MKWVSTFGYLPINHGGQLARISNHLQKVVFDNNLNGDAVRIRFSNRYSKESLTLQRVTIGTLRDGKSISAAQVTKDGNPVITLEPEEEFYSDKARLSISAGDQIEIYIYIKDEQSIGSVCSIVSTTGPRVYNEWPDEEGQVFYGFSGVQVYTDDDVKTISAFGDSIIQMSEMTNALYRRLAAAYPGKVSLVNRGISGNRLLYDAHPLPSSPGCEYRFGKAGLDRFEQDVFMDLAMDTALETPRAPKGAPGSSQCQQNRSAMDTALETPRAPGSSQCQQNRSAMDTALETPRAPKGAPGSSQCQQNRFAMDTALLLIGINDIMHPVEFLHSEELPTPEQLINGYTKLAEIAHAHDAKILIGTLLPCIIPAYPRSWAGIFERLRTAVNDWIRTQTVYDGWIDFDAAVRDKDHPDQMRADYHDGDGLHPNAAGGAAMAAAVDLSSLM